LLRGFDLLPEALPSASPCSDLLQRELLRSGLLCGSEGLRCSGPLLPEALCSGRLCSEGLRSGGLL
jgi:hypothetical protein